jgi:protein involved in polysaccharide export with SLBB domain
LGATLLLATLAGASQPADAHPQVPEPLPANITPDEAARILRGQPPGELVRRKIRQSGLSANEIRARLRAAGYPSGLLDAYLGPGDITPPTPRNDIVQVISMLGISSFTREDSLLATGDTVAMRMLVDSLRADSIAVADSLAELSRELELFGMDVFRQPTTQFQPLVTGPVDDGYILGPGDVLALILTGDVELAHTLEVTRGGFVVIPQVGQIPVNSLTLGEFKDVLTSRLRQSYSGIRRDGTGTTRFHVTVANVRVHTIRVIGEVARPGAYQIAATGTILTALYEAGGLTKRGNFRAVEVRRGSELVATVDLYDYLLRGTIANDVPLAPGDVIFVPVRGPRVKVAGEVTRPGIYELRPGETLADLVQVAGGLTPEAATEAVTIDRIVPPEERADLSRARTVMTVNLAEQVRLGSNSIPMLAGDSVHVFSVRGARRNSVTIRGSVWQEGTYELEPGMRLSDLFRMAGGLRPET